MKIEWYQVIHKFRSILVVGIIVLWSQHITIFANPIDKVLSINHSVSEKHEETTDDIEESLANTLDKTAEDVVDLGLSVDGTSSSSTNSETGSSEKQNNSDEIEIKGKTLTENIVTGIWRSVFCNCNSEAATVTLQGENAKTIVIAPQKTYTNKSIVVEGTLILQANVVNLFQNLKGLTYIGRLSFDKSQVTTFDFLFADSDSRS